MLLCLMVGPVDPPSWRQPPRYRSLWVVWGLQRNWWRFQEARSAWESGARSIGGAVSSRTWSRMLGSRSSTDAIRWKIRARTPSSGFHSLSFQLPLYSLLSKEFNEEFSLTVATSHFISHFQTFRIWTQLLICLVLFLEISVSQM